MATVMAMPSDRYAVEALSALLVRAKKSGMEIAEELRKWQKSLGWGKFKAAYEEAGWTHDQVFHYFRYYEKKARISKVGIPTFAQPKLAAPIPASEDDMSERERLLEWIREMQRIKEQERLRPRRVQGAVSQTVVEYANQVISLGMRELAKRLHPDHGGSVDGMQDLNAATTWLRTLIHKEEEKWLLP